MAKKRLLYREIRRVGKEPRLLPDQMGAQLRIRQLREAQLLEAQGLQAAVLPLGRPQVHPVKAQEVLQVLHHQPVPRLHPVRVNHREVHQHKLQRQHIPNQM